MLDSNPVLRALRFLYVQRVKGFTAPEAPHFDPVSLPLFSSLLQGARRYLEFGAGGSTLAAANLGVSTLSVESDRFYARVLRRRLPNKAPAEIIDADIGLTGNWGTPVFRSPTPGRLARWRRYIDLPFERLKRMGGPFPSLILIDGRFRRACALESARQAALANQAATLFFDDYAGREHYHEVERFLGAPLMAGRAAIFKVGVCGQNSVLKAAVDHAAADFR